MFLPAGGPNPQAWTHVELVNTATGVWTGTAQVAAGVTDIGQFFVALCDGAGNCGNSSNKAAQLLGQRDQLRLLLRDQSRARAPTACTPTPPPCKPTAPPAATSPSPSTPAAPQTCTTTCTVVVTGDGPNVVKITAPDGTTTVAAIPIDTHPPVMAVTSPAPNGRYKTDTVVPTTFTCTSALTITGCAGPAVLDTTTTATTPPDSWPPTSSGSPPPSISPTTSTAPPRPSPSATTPPTITNAGTAVFNFSATDPDEPAFPVTFTCQLDLAAAVPCASPYTATVPAPIDGAHVFRVVASDRVGNTTAQAWNWRIDTTGPVFQDVIGPADPTNQTTATFAYTVVDPPDTAALQFKLHPGRSGRCPAPRRGRRSPASPPDSPRTCSR